MSVDFYIYTAGADMVAPAGNDPASVAYQATVIPLYYRAIDWHVGDDSNT